MFQLLRLRLIPLGYQANEYKRMSTIDGGDFGIAIFSKGAILEYQWSELDDPMNTYGQMVKVATRCGEVRIFNTHPAPHPNPTCDALSHPTEWDLLDWVATFGDDMSFLMGDFNMVADDPQTYPCYDDFLATHRNGCDESSDLSCLDTVAAVGPGADAAIDHIFVKQGASSGFGSPWSVSRVWADHSINDVDTSGVGLVSDHWPVLGVFTQ